MIVLLATTSSPISTPSGLVLRNKTQLYLCTKRLGIRVIDRKKHTYFRIYIIEENTTNQYVPKVFATILSELLISDSFVSKFCSYSYISLFQCLSKIQNVFHIKI